MTRCGRSPGLYKNATRKEIFISVANAVARTLIRDRVVTISPEKVGMSLRTKQAADRPESSLPVFQQPTYSDSLTIRPHQSHNSIEGHTLSAVAAKKQKHTTAGIR